MCDKKRRIRNWEKFQHYQTGKRSEGPPDWIKLYPRLLNDYDYNQLEDRARIILIELFMLASEFGGALPPLGAICFRLRRHEKEVKTVLDRLPHWIETEIDPASNVLADCYQAASLEKKREEEKREEKIHTSPSGDECVQALQDYNLLANQTGLPQARDLTEARRKKLRALLEKRGLQEWREMLSCVPRQPFLLGEGERGWRADFDFFLQPKSFQKVLELAFANAPPRTIKQAATVGVYDRIISEIDNESNVIDLPRASFKTGSLAGCENNLGELHATASGPGNNVSLFSQYAGGSAACDVEADDGPGEGSSSA